MVKSLKIYQLKVTLEESQPPIWRTLQVPGSLTLDQLHEVLQTVMGWHDCHLYSFKIADTEYGYPDPENEFWGLNFQDSTKARLEKVVRRQKAKFTYLLSNVNYIPPATTITLRHCA